VTPAARPRIVIVGASTRAAAWSAWRGGYQPVCVDAFADRDLLQIAEVLPADYPTGIHAAIAAERADGWMFVGAMENHQTILAELQQLGQLGRYFGPPMAAIQSLRDPNWLADRLRPLDCYPEVICLPSGGRQPPGCGIQSDRDHNQGADAPRSENEEKHWLTKPLASGGGLSIRNADGARIDAGHYLQRRIPGRPMSALYLVSAAGCERLMLCEQLIGLPEAAPPGPFVYCGSLSGVTVSAEQELQLDRMVHALIEGLGYRGLIGIDLIWDGRKFWLIEVNPRYTASSELWELMTRQSAVGVHIAAFKENGGNSLDLSPRPRRGGEGQGEGANAPNDSRILGKAILYADRDIITPNLDRFLAARPLWSVPWLADIPATGSCIPTGAPICTVFASGITTEECRCKLLRRLQRVRAWFASRLPERGP